MCTNTSALKKRVKILPSILVSAALFTARVQARDFHAPAERPLQGTAYTPQAGQKTFTAGIFGTTYAEMVAAIGLAYAPTKFWNVGINLAHLGIGVLNVDTKLNMLDIKGFGLGFSAGFIYGHGDWIWALPALEKALISGIDMFVIPMELTAGADATKWLHFDLTAEYDHVEVLGELSGKHLFYDGAIGASRFLLRPVVRFYVKNRVSLNVDAKLPLWGRVREEVDTAVQLTDGVKGGVRSAGYKTLKPINTWLVTAGAEVEVATGLYLNTSLSVGGLSEKLFRRIMHMGMRLEWRF